MDLFFTLLLLLVATRCFGEIAVRLRQPILVGELFSGILLGAIGSYYAESLPFLAEMEEGEVFHAITDLAVFFLMLMAGLEMHPDELKQQSGGAFLVAIGGMVIPFGCGLLLGAWALPESDFRSAQLLYLGTALAVTAVPVSVKILLELGKLNTRFGSMIVSAALIDDALGLLLLSVLTGFLKLGHFPDLAELGILSAQILTFFVITVLCGIYVLPRFSILLHRLIGDESEFAGLLIVGLTFAVLAELLEMHFVVGAFAAGLFFTGRHFEPTIYKEIQQKVAGITNGFLAPIFFASIGLHLDPQALLETPGFLLLLIVAAVGGKLLGAGVPALMIGLPRTEAAVIGIAMSARATVELIIAKLALEAGLFEHPSPPPPIVRMLFSAIVVMALTTTILVPILVKQLVPLIEKEASGENEEAAASESGE